MTAAASPGSDRHDHPEDAHSHGTPVDPGSERRVLIALCITAGFAVVEVIGGIFSGSLALLADAGHMASDSAALALALVAFRIGRRPADAEHSFGHQRFQVLASFTNGLALLAIAVWITIEAVLRLIDPVDVRPSTMLAIAVAGLAVNIASFLVLRSGNRRNLNLRGATLHVMGDLLGSIAAIVAALTIIFTGWIAADPALSLVVAAIITVSGARLTRESGNILLQGIPGNIDRQEMRNVLVDAVAGLADVHHIHIWSMSGQDRIATLHAVIEGGADSARLLADIRQALQERYGIDHATIEVEAERSS